MAEQAEVLEVTGTVTWFDASKGYGFILPDDDSDDVLLNMNCLRAGGYPSARIGNRIRCEVLRRQSSLQAFNILSLD